MSFLKPIDYYLEGLEVALKGDNQEVIINQWKHSKDSLQRVIKAGAGATKLVIRASKINLDEDLDFSGPDYNIQVRVYRIAKELYKKEMFLHN